MSNYRISTELVLTHWRGGSTQAERLCSAILRLDGFDDIEPQAPLGGPDDRKDILCAKGGLKYVGAVYFPVSQKTFPTIKKKFLGDLEGPKRHRYDGIVFLTNQHLTVNQRSKLEVCALAEGKECLVYNIERLKSILDAPTGYGVRLEFLNILMHPDEQIAFFAHSGNLVQQAIEQNTQELGRIHSKIDNVLAGQDYTIQTLRQMAESSGFDTAALPSQANLQGGGIFSAEPSVGLLSAILSPELIVTFHRLSCYDLPPRMVGQFRNEEVLLGRIGIGSTGDMIELSPPNEIQDRLYDLCLRWNESYPALTKLKSPEKLTAIAKFHSQILQIHPFSDGNGRLGRVLIMQQCVDLFGRADMTLMGKGAEYFDALIDAGQGDFAPLARIISSVVKN